jgi:hypothetical protein
MDVDPFEASVRMRFIGNAEIETALTQNHQHTLRFVFEG